MKNRQIKPKPRLKTFHKSFLSRSLFVKCENDDTVLCQPNKIYLSKSRYDIKYLNFSFGAKDYTACTWPAARARGREHVNEIRPRCWVNFNSESLLFHSQKRQIVGGPTHTNSFDQFSFLCFFYFSVIIVEITILCMLMFSEWRDKLVKITPRLAMVKLW